MNTEDMHISYDLAEGSDSSTMYNLVRHRFKGILKQTEKAYLFVMETGTDKGLWVPKSMCIGMHVDSISKCIVVYIPDFCNSRECSLSKAKNG